MEQRQVHRVSTTMIKGQENEPKHASRLSTALLRANMKSEGSMKLMLTGPTHCAVCFLLVLLHGFCGAFLIACARLYWYLEHPYLEYFANLLAPPSKRHFKLIGTALGVLGALHLLRPLELMAVLVIRGRTHAPVAPENLAPVAPTEPRGSGATSAYQRITPLRGRRICAQGMFRPESEHFAWISIIMELTQIAAQVYQAHRSSHLIGRVWINRCYVAVVVIYCWTTPFLHRFLRRYSCIKRIAYLSVDALLTICYSIILPLVIFIPYIYEYDPEQYTFSSALLYGDVSFGNLILENQSIFAVSLLDCGGKLVPHVSAYLSLRAISRLIERNSGSTKPSGSSLRTLQKKKSIKGPSPELTNAAKGGGNLHLGASAAYKCVHVVFVCFGIAILAIHLVAARQLTGMAASGCKETMHPWFASKYSCAVFEFNCYRQGSSSPEPASLDFLDESTLTMLLFTHCPALVVPKSIQSFPNLLGMEIYNSTIAEWPKEAALSASIHQKMVFIVLSRVNMTRLPDGITLEPLPEMLQDIEIVGTNLTALPDTLHETWHSVSVLYLEHSQIQVFPETIFKLLNLYDFSLIGNQIEAIPDLLRLEAEFFVLALSHNPLKALPSAEDESGLRCEYLALENTDLGDIPEWVDRSIGEVVHLSGSPVCAARTGALSTATLRSAKLVCDEEDPRGSGRYPLAMIELHRQL